ncbi:bifunctional 4-hydroxy-2-oxoglutarate aldolase/2-dehydro-3-deoxy-phosphogluconate aldolase [Arsenicibacter rosenii]|uniref:Bifunctional 4-hydroxy-2-oxoglutarate aldolase/2-dehydro-3-deoxy-phosphogluconate aldolase n=1 Tax=Arsenicibacter rosenii TaxID=1750698 RepID=A0A1S2VH85_9BACT|nr:bifunctional 4-hydroxy-2-oxoglutarate aldolase/2-dehydro-3-deoxy-phosphogluconate aldolase [Arsenicibacter rosenii]OIN57556.1 bifunctional 4-hydroxy-2-oxoglutarate aldolase/2-dehydro-3-deoxy-phosphogluconate aldolase [Arsenicibacter rosenii]
MSSQPTSSLLQKCQQAPIVPVFYHPDAVYTKGILKACYDGGLQVFEYTNRGAGALEVFRELAAYVSESCPGMLLGAGTILTADDANAFIDAGASFIVQPVITPAVAEACQQRNIPWLPGAATLNEIHQATLLGAEVVKVFPGNVVGPGFIKAVKGPMPHLRLMVTGGVEPTADSLNAWFKAGVTCVGIGSQLFAGDNLPAAVLTDRIAQLLTILKPYIS